MADFKYKVGDRVIFINEYGVNWGEKTITGLEMNDVRGPTYYIEPTDTPWFATNEQHLHRPEEVHQCEICDEYFATEPIKSEETGLRQFCSDDCLQEAIDDLRIARIEAKEQYELYGDDLDSWLR